MYQGIGDKMVKIENRYVIKTPGEFEKELERSHFYFRKWTDKVMYGDEIEYEDFILIGEIGKNTHGIWVFEHENNPTSNDKYVSIEEAFFIYQNWVKKCKPNNAYDIADVDNDECWNEDNEYKDMKI